MSVELPYLRYGRLAGTTLVDDDVAESLSGRVLRLQVGGYVFVGPKQLHRMVMGCVRGDGLVCHHINEDTTDNRRENLQLFTSLSDHGVAPHPWRDRTGWLAARYGGRTARKLIEYEQACAGLRVGLTRRELRALAA